MGRGGGMKGGEDGEGENFIAGVMVFLWYLRGGVVDDAGVPCEVPFAYPLWLILCVALAV